MMDFKSKIFVRYFPFYFLALILGCGKPGEIRIGITSNKDLKYMPFCGASVAVEEINKAGGIRGKKLVLIPGGTGGPMAAAKLIEEGVLAVIDHHSSSNTIAAYPVYAEAGVVELTTNSTSPKISRLGPWVFRFCISDVLQGKFLADYAVNKLGKSKIAIFFENTDYGRGLKKTFVERARPLGADVIYQTTCKGDVFEPQTILAVKKGAQLIFLAGQVGQAVKLAQQLQKLAPGLPILGGDSLYRPKLIESGSKAVEGVMFTLFFHPAVQNEKVKEFSSKFKAEFGKPPDAEAAFTYDAVQLLAAAIREKGLSRKGIRDYLAGLGTTYPAFEGVTGTTAFDVNGDCVKPIYIGTVKHGKIVLAEVQL